MASGWQGPLWRGLATIAGGQRCLCQAAQVPPGFTRLAATKADTWTRREILGLTFASLSSGLSSPALARRHYVGFLAWFNIYSHQARCETIHSRASAGSRKSEYRTIRVAIHCPREPRIASRDERTGAAGAQENRDRDNPSNSQGSCSSLSTDARSFSETAPGCRDHGSGCVLTCGARHAKPINTP
jgi:hypothetical protein